MKKVYRDIDINYKAKNILKNSITLVTGLEIIKKFKLTKLIKLKKNKDVECSRKQSARNQGEKNQGSRIAKNANHFYIKKKYNYS